jgi:hypothetical protein
MIDERTLQNRLERALVTAAELVAHHGDAYAPVFERVEEELTVMRRRSGVADRARQLAASIAADHASAADALFQLDSIRRSGTK